MDFFSDHTRHVRHQRSCRATTDGWQGPAPRLRGAPHPHLRLAVLLLLALATALSGCAFTSDQPPRARYGVIDLTRYNFQTKGPLALDGQWEVYWDKLIPPEEFTGLAKTPQSLSYAAFPYPWRALKKSPHSGDTGQATFRLRVLAGPGAKKIMPRLLGIKDAYKLWVNGILVAAEGMPGEDTTEETTSASPVPAGLTVNDPNLDMVLWVSGHRPSLEVSTSIVLGTPITLELWHLRAWWVLLLIVGSVGTMGSYYTLLYFKQKTLSYFYFALLCFLWIGYFISDDTSRGILPIYMPDIDISIVYKFHLLCYAITRSIGYRFLKSLYYNDFSKLFQRINDAMSIILIPIILYASQRMLSLSLLISFLATIIVLVYCIYILILCVIRKRDWALIILFGYTVFSVFGVNRMLCQVQNVNILSTFHAGVLLEIGMLTYVISQTITLALSFSKTFLAEKELSVALERKNIALSEEIHERDRLERKLVHIYEDERRRFSHELHDGLCQHLTGARLHCSVLEDRIAAGPTGNELKRLSELLDASVDSAYDLSRGLMPVEYDMTSSVPPLEALVRRVGGASNHKIDLHEELRCDTCVNPHATVLFRIAQEALTNAIKHAKANHIAVNLHCTGSRLIMSVVDDGIGRAAASPPKGGLGSEIMAHRAKGIKADLEITDAPGGGTIVWCAAPCPVAAAMVGNNPLGEDDQKT